MTIDNATPNDGKDTSRDDDEGWSSIKIRKYLEQLTDAATKNALDADRLSEAINTVVYDQGDALHISLGTEWLNHRAMAAQLQSQHHLLAECEKRYLDGALQRLLPNTGIGTSGQLNMAWAMSPVTSMPDPAAFVRDNMAKEEEFAALVLRTGELLQTLPENERIGLARTTLQNMRNIGAMLFSHTPLCIPDPQVAEITLELLRSCPVSTPAQHGTLATFFVAVGISDRSVAWRAMDQGQKLEALIICAEKAPKALVDQLRHLFAVGMLDESSLDKVLATLVANAPNLIMERLSDMAVFMDRQKWNRLLIATADKLRRAGQYAGSSETVCALPLAERHVWLGEVAAKYRTNWQLARAAVKTAVERLTENPESLPTRLLNPLDTVVLVKAAYAMGFLKHPLLRPYLDKRLLVSQTILGRVQRGSYYNRRSQRQEAQLQVRHGHYVFIHDRMEHRYAPHDGDMVLVNTLNARILSSQRKDAVVFISSYQPLDTSKLR